MEPGIPKLLVLRPNYTSAQLGGEQKIKDLIAYLHTFDKAPVKLSQQ